MSQWLNRSVWGAWVLGETWRPGDPLSSMHKDAPRWGVWVRLPEDKSRNSWRWLFWRPRINGPIYSLRSTLPAPPETP